MISFTSITKDTSGAWIYEWTDTLVDSSEFYRIILDGAELDTQATNTYSLYVPGFDNKPPFIEVVKNGEFAVSERNRQYMILQWNRVEDDPPIVSYDIEWYNGSEWVVIQSISQSDYIQVFTHVSNFLADKTSFQMRVVPVNDERREGDAQTFKTYIVRRPNPVTLTSTCVSGTLTIS